MPSEKIEAIRAHWDGWGVSLNVTETAQAREDVCELLIVVERAEELLNCLRDRDQAPPDARGPIRYVGKDVWVNDVTTAAAAVEETRALLADALGWEPPSE
jgi:hypothetical protein